MIHSKNNGRRREEKKKEKQIAAAVVLVAEALAGELVIYLFERLFKFVGGFEVLHGGRREVSTFKSQPAAMEAACCR